MKAKLELGKAAKGNANSKLYDQMISSNEFIAVLRDAEKEPFMTPKEALKEFEKWLISRGKN